MYYNKIILTRKDILEKDFKIDTRGYRPQEVDKYLDIIMQDYEAFENKIKDVTSENKELLEDNLRLKQEIRTLKLKLETLKENTNPEVNNADLLRRLSNLEKVIYGKYEYDKEE